MVSPLKAKVLSGVLGHLRTTGLLAPQTEVVTQTAAGQCDRYPGRIFDAWRDETTQKGVLGSLSLPTHARASCAVIQSLWVLLSPGSSLVPTCAQLVVDIYYPYHAEIRALECRAFTLPDLS
jgi:hypothetical protein